MVVRGVTRAFLYSVAVTLLLSAQFTVADHFDEEETEVFDDVDAGGETKVVKEEIINEVVYVSPRPSGPVNFFEHFDDEDSFKTTWVKSSAKKEGVDEDIAKYDGIWSLETLAKDYLDGDRGLVLKSKAKHAAIAAKLARPFSFKSGKSLIVQYEVAFQHGMDCGGAYMKLISDQKHLDLGQFHDKTKYSIMFGPDKCGNDHKLHFIFQHRNPKNGTYTEKHAKRPSAKIEDVFKDKKPHLFTLVLNPDNTFEVLVDNELANSGSLLTDFDPPVNPAKEIDDPVDVKPTDWDEREKIPDPAAKKPEDWDEDAPRHVPDETAVKPAGWLDDEEEMVPDPEAKKPEDWDDEMDGAWEAPLINNPACDTAPGCGKWTPPMIDNPSYKGKWYPPMIDNPAYKGKWAPRKIPNPDYFEDLEPFKMDDIGAIGFELWSMSDGVYFDNIIIAADRKVVEDFARDSFQLKLDVQDAGEQTFWSKVMFKTNNRPHWWALWAVYVSIPIGFFIYKMNNFRYADADEAKDSLFRRVVRFTNKNPWMWAVIVVVVGLPFVLILTFCCGGSSTEKNAGSVAQAKKTDAASPDDEQEEQDEPTSEGDERALLRKRPKKTRKADLELASGDSAGLNGDVGEEQDDDGEREVDEDGEEEDEETVPPSSDGDDQPLVTGKSASSPVRRRTRKD